MEKKMTNEEITELFAQLGKKMSLNSLREEAESHKAWLSLFVNTLTNSIDEGRFSAAVEAAGNIKNYTAKIADLEAKIAELEK